MGPQNARKIPLKPLKMAILRPNLKNDVPEYSEWARVAQYSSFQCQQRWWGPFGQKDILGAHTRTQNAPKIHLKPPKMAILGPNLKHDVPKTSEWARLAQYSSFQCQQRWWGPFGQKDILGGPYEAPKCP